MITNEKNLKRTIALGGYGAISRADGSGSINKGSQVKVRPAPPAPTTKAQAVTRPPIPPKSSEK